MCFNLGSCTINFVCHFINGLIERLRIQELFDKKRGSKKKVSLDILHRYYLLDSIKVKEIKCSLYHFLK